MTCSPRRQAASLKKMKKSPNTNIKVTTKPLIALVLLGSLQLLTLGTALAFQSKDVSPQSQEPIQQKPQIGSGIQLLSDTQGVDFNSYLRTMYLSVKYKWQPVLPQSVGSGEQGRNTVQFRVLQDGTVPEEFLKLVFSSEKPACKPYAKQPHSATCPRNIPRPLSFFASHSLTTPHLKSDDQFLLEVINGNWPTGRFLFLPLTT